MPASTYYIESHFAFDVTESNVLLYSVLASTSAGMGGLGLTNLPNPGFSAGYEGDWYNPAKLAPRTPTVEHVMTVEHTPLAESIAIDGVPLNFNPSPGFGYVAAMAGLEAEFFEFYYLPGVNPPLTGDGYLDRVTIGSAPGRADYLDWTAATDGAGPFVGAGPGFLISGGRMVFPAPNGGGCRWDFIAPWPPTYSFRVSFSVGVTHNGALTPDVPPPDDLYTVWAALPETLLTEGFTIEIGSYDEQGAARASDVVREATLGFASLIEPEDEP